MATIPTGVTVFAYQVGFGDCLLVRFEYPGSKNLHLLIDFGTTKLPPTADKKRMQEIADDIKQKCGTAGLLAVVATHRHQDHISGFATNAQGTASGNVIASLKPKLVLQPWTEHPKVAVDATGPAFAGPNGGGKGFAQALVGMQKFANRVTQFAVSEAGKRLSPAVREQLSFIGQNNLSNLSAVQNLMNMGQGAKGEYLYFGARTKLAKGVRGPCQVLNRAVGPGRGIRAPQLVMHAGGAITITQHVKDGHATTEVLSCRRCISFDHCQLTVNALGFAAEIEVGR